MSSITKPQPAGPVRHGAHCQGGVPGWEACRRCVERQAPLCRAFWMALAGEVPAMIEANIARRIARAEGRPVR